MSTRSPDQTLLAPLLFAVGVLVTQLLACGSVAAPPARQSGADLHADVEGVRDTVTLVTHEIDAKRWDELEKLYAEEVTTDYTSLFGGTPVKQPSGSLIGGWKGALGKVATHHQLGPITVKLVGGRATATCQVRALHRADGAPGGTDWEVLAHYVFELSKSSDGTWKIHGRSVLRPIQTGNAKLLQEAGAAR
jgi:hypothetical protein